LGEIVDKPPVAAAVRRAFSGLCRWLAAVSLLVLTSSSVAGQNLALSATRSSPLDLEVAGNIPGVPAGSPRFITRKELLALPQVSYTVSDDANFSGPTPVSGVDLAELSRRLGVRGDDEMVIAICSDKYRANYPAAYIAAHHPLLVLEIDGKGPAQWPKDSETHTMEIGPYLISHPKFTPGFKIPSAEDEAQIPWGVVRLDFRSEKQVFAAIAPRGPRAGDAAVQAGFQIAGQNCFRCHNSGREGGEKAGVSWAVLATLAAAAPENFMAYIRNPKTKDPDAQMPGNPNYDDATLQALTAYFQTFSKRPNR
jgi:mono/diheme cytochrome c family protein